MNLAVLSPTERARTMPPFPTRDQLCAIRESFNTLWIDTPSYGRIPWWETIAMWPNPADRQAAYRAKRAAGDTHIVVNISERYGEPGIIGEYNFIGADYTQNLPALVAIAEEAIAEGFLIDFKLAMDGESNPERTHNDPVGWTYGYDWGMENLDRIMEAFAHLSRYMVWVPGYDGVFYGWEPSGEKVPAFARKIRARFPDAAIGIEFNTGHIPIGEGGADYLPGGRMQDYDVILAEYDPFNYHSSSTWQIAGRMEQAYRQPADQNDNDHRPAQPYTAVPNARGRWYFINYETLTYRHVRGWVSAEEYAAYRDYFVNQMNCEFVC